MPQNKNSYVRYKILDEMLSDRHHFFSTQDLFERLNYKLLEEDYEEVTLRCVQKDLKALQEAPFFAEMERGKSYGEDYVRYADPSFSLFQKQLSPDERLLLREVLSTIGQFDGLDNFEWLQTLGEKLKSDSPSRKAISFSNNPFLHNSSLLGTLFRYITHEVVIELEYKKFGETESARFIVHPYLLKQYNNRWYLYAAVDSDRFVATFPLDRIVGVTPRGEMEYRPCDFDLDELSDDIVGITLYRDRDIEHITLWVDDKSLGYVETKPIHGSQTTISGSAEEQLRRLYPSLVGGRFFTLDCIPNYELIRELSSFGANLIVLSPDGIQQAIVGNLSAHLERYGELRTKRSSHGYTFATENNKQEV